MAKKTKTNEHTRFKLQSDNPIGKKAFAVRLHQNYEEKMLRIQDRADFMRVAIEKAIDELYS